MVKAKKNSVTLFDNLKEGLHSAIQLESGKRVRGVRITKIIITPLRKRSPTQIRNLRVNLNMTQSVFAGVLGVSKKAVEAWEAGTKSPSGPALRMLEILEKESIVLERVGIFSRTKSA
jgi:putative transcriptional regulator